MSSTPYRVSMEVRGDADDPTALAEPRCSCPSAADEGFCKHMPLLAMAYLDDPASFPAVAEDLADLQDESKPMRAEAGICAGHAALLRGEPFAVVYRDRQITIWRRCKNCDAVPPMESLVFGNRGAEIYWRHLTCLRPAMVNQVARALWPGEPAPRCERIPGWHELDADDQRVVEGVFSNTNAKPLKPKAASKRAHGDDEFEYDDYGRRVQARGGVYGGCDTVDIM